MQRVFSFWFVIQNLYGTRTTEFEREHKQTKAASSKRSALMRGFAAV
jgi:hypothetical protein